jgi:hypothetical protein
MIGTIYQRKLADRREVLRVYHDGKAYRLDHITDLGEEIEVRRFPTMKKACEAVKNIINSPK